MVKRNNNRLKKLWIATVLSLSLSATPALAAAEGIYEVENDNVVKTVLADPIIDVAEAACEEIEIVSQTAPEYNTTTYVSIPISKTETDKKGLSTEVQELIAENQKTVSENEEKVAGSESAVADAEKDQQEKQEAYDKALDDYEKAKAEFEAAKAEYESLSILGDNPQDTIDKNNAYLENAQKIKDQAQAEVDAAKAALDSAKAEESTAKTALDAALSEKNSAAADLASANADVNNAKAALSAAEAELAKHDESSAEYTAAAAAVEDAKTALASAENKAAEAEATVSEKEAKVADAQAALSAAESKHNEKQAALSAAETKLSELDTASGDVTDSENNLSAKEAQEAAALTAMNEAHEALTAAESKVSIAQAELTAANKALSDAKDEFEKDKAALQKAVDDAQAAYDKAALEFLKSNCIDYDCLDNYPEIKTYNLYDYLIKEMLETESLKDYTGEVFEDALSKLITTEYLEKYMDFIDQANDLRAENGVGELYVDYNLMLISSISNAVSQQAGYDGGHYFYNKSDDNIDLAGAIGKATGPQGAENLSFAHDDPFDAWYYDEKYLYDKGIRDERVGHYLNLLNPNYNVTGFSKAYEGPRPLAQQNFGYKEGASLTTEDFKTALTNYVKDLKDALDAAKEALANADDSAVKDAESQVASKEAALNSANSEKDAAKSALGEKEEAYTDAKSETDAAKESLKQVKEKEALAKSAYEKALSDADAFGDTLKDIADAQKALDDANKDLTAAENALKEAENEKADKENELVSAKKSLSDLDKLILSLKDDKVKAEEALSDAEKKAEEVKAAYDEKASAAEKAEKTYSEKKDIASDAEKALSDAEDELTSKLPDFNEAQKTYTQNVTICENYIAAETALNYTIANIDAVRIDLEAAKDALESAEKLYEENLKELEQVKINALSNVKNALKAEIANYKDPDDYREAEQAELIKTINAAKITIDISETIETAVKAAETAMEAMDSIKTDAQLKREEGFAGDANRDEKVNVKDAVLVLQYANKKITADELELALSDVNGDGKVNVKDATMILQYANKKIDSFPVEQ